MGFHFAEIVADLVEGIGFRRQTEGRQYCLAQFCGPPSVQLSATVAEDLHHPHHSRIVDLDARPRWRIAGTRSLRLAYLSFIQWGHAWNALPGVDRDESAEAGVVFERVRDDPYPA